MSKFVRPACLAIGLLLVPVMAASADDKKEAPAKGQLPQNFGKLGLSEEQKAKVYAVQAKFKSRLAELKKQLEEVQKEEKTAIFDLLTDAQKARLKELALEKIPGGSGSKPDKKTDDKPSTDKPK